MAIMDLFTSLQTIINERSAKKVRQSIHDGIFRANQVVDANKNLVDQVAIRQDNLETQTAQSVAQMEADKNAVVANATVDSEVILARGGKPTLQARLDEMAVKGSGVSTNLSLRNGWVGTVRWRKSDGDVVTIEVDVAKPSSISPLDDIATLPENIRTFEKVFPVVSTTTGKIEFLYINANGVLRTPANSTLQPSLSYHGVITYTV